MLSIFFKYETVRYFHNITPYTPDYLRLKFLAKKMLVKVVVESQNYNHVELQRLLKSPAK